LKVEDVQAVDAEQVEEEGTDEGVDLAAVSKDGEEDEVDDSVAVAGLDEEDVVESSTALPNPEENTERSSKKSKRSSKKRKALEAEEEEADRSDLEAPPDVEADQPVSKKKLKVNTDGTVDYVDDVR
jgi:5'-3' exoribonuclease 2